MEIFFIWNNKQSLIKVSNVTYLHIKSWVLLEVLWNNKNLAWQVCMQRNEDLINVQYSEDEGLGGVLSLKLPCVVFPVAWETEALFFLNPQPFSDKQLPLPLIGRLHSHFLLQKFILSKSTIHSCLSVIMK